MDRRRRPLRGPRRRRRLSAGPPEPGGPAAAGAALVSRALALSPLPSALSLSLSLSLSPSIISGLTTPPCPGPLPRRVAGWGRSRFFYCISRVCGEILIARRYQGASEARGRCACGNAPNHQCTKLRGERRLSAGAGRATGRRAPAPAILQLVKTE